MLPRRSFLRAYDLELRVLTERVGLLRRFKGNRHPGGGRFGSMVARAPGRCQSQTSDTRGTRRSRSHRPWRPRRNRKQRERWCRGRRDHLRPWPGRSSLAGPRRTRATRLRVVFGCSERRVRSGRCEKQWSKRPKALKQCTAANLSTGTASLTHLPDLSC